MKIKVLAVDVCGTLFDANTTAEFVLHHHKSNGKQWLGWLIDVTIGRKKVIPYIFSVLGRVLGFDLHRYLVIKSLKGCSKNELDTSAGSYVCGLSAKRIEAIHILVAQMQADGYRVILVSNSLDIVISNVANHMGVEFVSSEVAWVGNKCGGYLKRDLTGAKRRYLECYLTCGLENIVFSVVTDNRSDGDLIVAGNPAFIVAHEHIKKWMKQYDANIITL